MSPRRILVLLSKEFVRGPRNFMFVFALVIPVLVTLVLSLLFGTIFSEKPRLGLSDQGNSALATMAEAQTSLVVRRYDSPAALQDAVSIGAVDMGMVVPAGFDGSLAEGRTVEVDAYVWGESLLKNRSILGTTLAGLMRDLAGQEPPVEIVTTSLGESEVLPLEDRIMPLIVLMTILMSSVMVPATSLVDEKQKRTLTALVVTPTGLGEVFIAKGLLGVILSLVTGVLILVLNQAFGGQPGLLILTLVLGGVFGATIGVLLGAFTKDINTLFATIKGMGILLYAPAIIFLFPGIPEWIGRIFPTFYIVGPVVELTLQGAGFSDIAPELAVLVGLTAVSMAAVSVAANRLRQREL